MRQPGISTHVLTLLLGVVVLSSCTMLSRKPFTSPANGGPAWTEVKSAHFVVTTDLDAQAAQRASAELEATYSALSDLGFASADKPKMRAHVVYFRRREEYERIAPRLTSGISMNQRGYDFESESLAIVQGDLVERNREQLQHELTHFFVQYYYPQAPVWLNEGLAEYYETLDLVDGTATLGRLSLGDRFWKGPWKWRCSPEGCTGLVPMSEALRVSALVKMGSAEFYGDQKADPRTGAGMAAARAMTAHYRSAHSLVHLLIQDPAYKPAFAEFMRRLRTGEPSESAWSGTVGRLPSDKLEADFRDSLVRPEVIVERTPYAPPKSSPESVRTLSEGEVHMLWAWVWTWDSPEGHAAALKELNDVPEQSRHEPEFALLGAYWLYSQGDAKGAEKVLRDALTSRPDDARLLNSLGWVVLEGMKEDGAAKAEIAAALEPVAARLAPMAKTTAQYDLLARYSEAKGALLASVAHEKQALATDPGCVQCMSFMAHALGEQGHVGDALAVALLAQGLLRDGARSSAIARQIDAYRRRLSSIPIEEPPLLPQYPCDKQAPEPGAGPKMPLAAGPPALPSQTVAKILGEHRRDFRRCYRKGLRKDPNLVGKVTVRFVIGPDGTVEQARPICTSMPNPDVVRCVVDAERKLSFPPPDGGTSTVETPITFALEDED